jgi:hypothetical protein
MLAMGMGTTRLRKVVKGCMTRRLPG